MRMGVDDLDGAATGRGATAHPVDEDALAARGAVVAGGGAGLHGQDAVRAGAHHRQFQPVAETEGGRPGGPLHGDAGPRREGLQGEPGRPGAADAHHLARIQPAEPPLVPGEHVGRQAELAAHQVPVTDVGVPVTLAVGRAVVEVGQVEDMTGLMGEDQPVRRMLLEHRDDPSHVRAVHVDGRVQVDDLGGVGVHAGRVRVRDEVHHLVAGEVDGLVGHFEGVPQIRGPVLGGPVPPYGVRRRRTGHTQPVAQRMRAQGEPAVGSLLEIAAGLREVVGGQLRRGGLRDRVRERQEDHDGVQRPGGAGVVRVPGVRPLGVAGTGAVQGARGRGEGLGDRRSGDDRGRGQRRQRGAHGGGAAQQGHGHDLRTRLDGPAPRLLCFATPCPVCLHRKSEHSPFGRQAHDGARHHRITHGTSQLVDGLNNPSRSGQKRSVRKSHRSGRLDGDWKGPGPASMIGTLSGTDRDRVHCGSER
ncbi:hypothetical protein SGPA1_30197 [Streptomyces misionensis JCM 4497]